MSGRAVRGMGAAVLAALLILGYALWRRPQCRVAAEGGDTLLLLPDALDARDPRVAIWLDAAAEEGLHVRVARDSEFMQLPAAGQRYRGVILPDQVHRAASDGLVDALDRYVTAGGKLLLVYDAGTLTPTGVYPIPRSRFSHMVGVDYALYDQLRSRTTRFDPVWGTEASMRSLRVPPGKYMPVGRVLGVGSSVLGNQSQDPRPNTQRPTPNALVGISGYRYGALKYPVFVTRGKFAGTTLLTSSTGDLVAGYHRHGRGGVLFANVPLGYLKGRTDGLLLHGVLDYFAERLLHLPHLSPLPESKAGMVLNWHLDSKAAEPPLAFLMKRGVFQHGPFSIHITAGPDTIAIGDQLGFDLPNNPPMQNLLREFVRQGHQVGSHGGWIHDYWGARASETNQASFEKFLVLNQQAVEKVTGKPMLEYSAPVGNHPEWCTTWLEQRSVLGYYFTGNSGMAPTRSYRNGRQLHPKIWSFPIASYGRDATLEEFKRHHVPDTEITGWLNDLVDFCVEERTCRLIYFHPPGAAVYPEVIQSLLQRAQHHAQARRFHWYTMTGLAQFLNRREAVRWSVTRAADGTHQFIATHPEELAQHSWVLPAAAYQRPEIEVGKGSVRQEGDDWIVTSAGGRFFRFVARVRGDGVMM